MSAASILAAIPYFDMAWRAAAVSILNIAIVAFVLAVIFEITASTYITAVAVGEFEMLLTNARVLK